MDLIYFESIERSEKLIGSQCDVSLVALDSQRHLPKYD